MCGAQRTRAQPVCVASNVLRTRVWKNVVSEFNILFGKGKTTVNFSPEPRESGFSPWKAEEGEWFPRACQQACCPNPVRAPLLCPP